MQAVDALSRRLVHPAERLRGSRQLLQQLEMRLTSATSRLLERIHSKVRLADARLANLGHIAVLARGYSLTLGANGKILRDAAAVAVGERIVTTLAKGEIESEVKKRG